MCLSPEGSLIVVGDDTGEIKLFTYEDCKLIHVEQPHAFAISAVAVSPDNTLVITADESGHLMMWRA
jgi:WD40 repeat protein